MVRKTETNLNKVYHIGVGSSSAVAAAACSMGVDLGKFKFNQEKKSFSTYILCMYCPYSTMKFLAKI